MINAHGIRTSVLALMVAALALATIAAQVVTSFIVKALGDSQTVRVSPAAASCTTDGTHFTGCSSIL